MIVLKQFTNVFNWYNKKLIDTPILTSSFTAGILGSLGDYIN